MNGTVFPNSPTRHSLRGGLLATLACCVLLFLCGLARSAPQPISTADPAAFFTNVAARVLQSELNLELSRIQVYPTNQYTPVVHRLLQITANIYDCTTNRSLTGYPYLPSVFRPLFRRDDTGNVFIAGYREVTDDSLADPATAPLMVQLNQGSITNIPPIGTPVGGDNLEPLVSAVPLVIGVKKGIPNFNEFAMNTRLDVRRYLEFRRNPALPPDDPANRVIETNQLCVVSLTNTFGIEAWNSYTNTYPRSLTMFVEADLRAWITNGTGVVVFTNRSLQATNLIIPPNSWTGWMGSSLAPGSFVLPFGGSNSFPFLPISSYITDPPSFVPTLHVFERQSGFYVPQWWLNLGIRLRYVLVDADVHRVLDYVNLDSTIEPLDIMTKLREGADCSTLTQSGFRNLGNLWCTNRVGNSTNNNAPTYGILNQIILAVNGTDNDYRSFSLDPWVGNNVHYAVDFFRWNLRLMPIFNTGLPLYQTNVFYAPFSPYRPVNIDTPWQANDPVVHYTLSDLNDLSIAASNRVNFYYPLLDLGLINVRFQPWGGNPRGPSNPEIGHWDIAAKDPLISRPETWTFPANQSLNMTWLGQVHRGTPWQTMFLKSTNVLANGWSRLMHWRNWVGVADPWQARAMAPTNDWRLASLLASIFNTNDPHALLSVNQQRSSDWAGVLDGLTVLTNTGPYQFEEVTISSNAPQTTLVADAMTALRFAQPAQVFRMVGDLFAAPELSINSPWLNFTYNGAISDEAFEIIPCGLLSRLRPDSAGSITTVQSGDRLQIQFTGFQGYPYRLETSLDLANWTAVSTNYPTNGVFTVPEALPTAAAARFYRSMLLP